MSDLGQFSEGFGSWRQILSTVPPDDRLRIFANAAADVATYVGKGLDKMVAADELADIAIACGLDDADAVQATIAEAFKNGRDPEPPQDAPRFKLKRFNEIVLSTARNYLIKGLLPRRGLAVIWGTHKCGKSFIAFDMGMHIALGWPYRGRRVQKGAVVYLAPEGGSGFPARVEAWRQRFLTADDTAHEIPFRLLNDVRIDLIADHHELIAAIRTQVEQPPAAIFVDTVNRSLIGDENASADMGKYVRAADALGTAFDCLIVLIHHSGVAGGRPRGHSSLSGADDVQISVAMDASGLITVTVDHMKDGPVAPPFGCRLESVRARIDDDGDPITSCVLVPAAAGANASIRLNSNQARFVDILRETIACCPATPIELQGTATVPNGVIPVTRDVLKKYCVTKGWLDDTESNNSRAKLSNMLNALAGKNVIGLTNRFVWMIP
jgi:AAA domain